MADFIFDGPNRVAIEPPGVTTVDVERDIYSAWKRWVVLGDGARYPRAFIVEGGTPIGSTGIFTGSSFILTNGWKIRMDERDHETQLLGNLFSDDGVLTVPTLGGFTATPVIVSAVQAQGIATGSAVTQQDMSDIADRVWERMIDATGGLQ